MLKTANYQLSCILEKIGINLFNMCHSEFISESIKKITQKDMFLKGKFLWKK